MKIRLSEIRKIIREELSSVGVSSPQGQMGIKSTSKRKKEKDCGCGCENCKKKQIGSRAFQYELLRDYDEEET